jgi:hypothetical protein
MDLVFFFGGENFYIVKKNREKNMENMFFTP